MRHFHRTEKRTWSLIDENGHILGSLIQPKWWSHKFELVVPEGVLIVRSNGALRTDQTVYRGDAPLADLKFSWKGDIHITPRRPGAVALHVVRTNWWGRSYIIKDDLGAERARVCMRMDWSKFVMGPVLEESASNPLSAMDLLLAVHGIQETYRRAAAAT
ncbi:MAG: hypothetical protein JNL43_17190 [Flavobacteriales bacterium]|nr:hypothetical protein [Flavobacteriales bacterium]